MIILIFTRLHKQSLCMNLTIPVYVNLFVGDICATHVFIDVLDHTWFTRLSVQYLYINMTVPVFRRLWPWMPCMSTTISSGRLWPFWHVFWWWWPFWPLIWRVLLQPVTMWRLLVSLAGGRGRWGGCQGGKRTTTVVCASVMSAVPKTEVSNEKLCHVYNYNWIYKVFYVWFTDWQCLIAGKFKKHDCVSCWSDWDM